MGSEFAGHDLLRRTSAISSGRAFAVKRTVCRAVNATDAVILRYLTAWLGFCPCWSGTGILCGGSDRDPYDVSPRELSGILCAISFDIGSRAGFGKQWSPAFAAGYVTAQALQERYPPATPR